MCIMTGILFARSYPGTKTVVFRGILKIYNRNWCLSDQSVLLYVFANQFLESICTLSSSIRFTRTNLRSSCKNVCPGILRLVAQ